MRKFFDRIIHKLGLKSCLVPDKLYLSSTYRLEMGARLNWSNPQTFTEKLQWLKIYNRNTKFTELVDKELVKDYVAKVIGKQYIIPTIASWDRVEDVDINALPDQFVLKCTHDSGCVVICHDKLEFDWVKEKSKLEKAFKRNFYLIGREWPYKDVRRRVIAETFMKECGHPKDSADYIIICYNGNPVCCQAIRDCMPKGTNIVCDKIRSLRLPVSINDSGSQEYSYVPCPESFEDIKAICRELTGNFMFSRVDVYVINDQEYFCDVAIYPDNSIEKYNPDESLSSLCDLLKLKGKNVGGYNCSLLNKRISISLFDESLKDYKFFCFEGEVKFFKVDFDRFSNHHANYYSPEGNLLEFGEADFPPKLNKDLVLPENLNTMIELAEKLSKGHVFLRVDFYSISGKIYFGELTFFPASGFEDFTPKEYNKIIGDMINIDKIQL